MSEIKDELLSESLDNIRISVRLMYPEYYSLLHKVNRLAVLQQHTISIHPESQAERYAACLFARTLTTVQASVLVLEVGMVPQAQMLLRSALETLFTLGAIAKKPTIVDRLIEGHAVEQKRVAKNMGLWKSPHLKKIADAETLQSFLESPANTISAFDLAKEAGLEDWYRTVYMIFSWPVHGAATDLDRHVVLGPDGEVSEFKNEPELEGQETEWMCCIELLLKALTFLAKIFAEVDQEQVDRLYSEAHALHRKSKG
jgi:hypothetical protein